MNVLEKILIVLIGFMFSLVVLSLMLLPRAIDEHNKYVMNCEAKGGEAFRTKSGMICINKESLIKE